MAKNGKATLSRLSQKELENTLIRSKKCTRSGAATIIRRRMGNADYRKYNTSNNQVFYAATNNMKKAENKLLRHKSKANIHQYSNAKEKKGYIYVIKFGKGTKNGKK